MPLDLQYFDPTAPADSVDATDLEVNPHWAENLITAVATALAVMVVAAVAVLIGMA